MTYTLRSYQARAVERIVDWCSQPRFSGAVLSLPTGSGKTLVIAEATRQLNRHTLILCSNQELVRQDVDKLKKFVDPKDVGIYSASLKSKQIKRFTIGTIGSVANHPELFSHFKLVVVDECDCFISDHKNFSKVMEHIGSDTHLVGLTATPFRLETEQSFYSDSMYITTSLQMITKFEPWRRIIFKLNNWDLVEDGYILPVKIKDSYEFVDLETVKQNTTDYDIDDYSWRFLKYEPSALSIINGLAKEHKSIVCFCTSVAQAQRLSEQFNAKNKSIDLFSTNVYLSGVVHADTSKKERLEIIDKFKAGKMSVLFNVNILTRGFDYEGLDCAVLLRPTRSLGLYTQMVGRIMRPYPGKKFGTLVDLTGTVRKLGRVEYSKVDRDENGEWGVYVGDQDGLERLDGEVLYEFERPINRSY